MPLRVENAVDLHCHFGPDTIGGSVERGPLGAGVPAIETAREARNNGYSAIVLKPHGFASPGLAETIEQAVPGLRILGGICTDYATGGLNVYAVEAALALGARIVWLPTVHSSIDFGRYPIGERHTGLQPIHVIDDDGNPLPEIREIFDLVKEAGAILATGHISADEHRAIVREFAGSGKVLVTHAAEERGGAQLTPAQCAELADLGAIIEVTALTCQHLFGVEGKSPKRVAQFLQAVGPQRCTLSTDYGWMAAEIPRPAAGFHEFLEALWQAGLPESDLVTMASTMPARLLELPGV